MVSDYQRPIPLDVLRLAQATRAYMECLKASLPAVVALGEPAGFLRDQIDGCLKSTEWGSAAAVDMAIRDLCCGS